MTLFGIISTLGILFLIFVDKIFLPRQSKAALRWMSSFYILILIFIWWPAPFERLADLLDLARPIDMIIYLSIVILLRDFFLSRQRAFYVNKTLTVLTRELALAAFSKKDPKN